MTYMDVKTAAAQWNLPERRITALCRNGRITGAKKEGGLWLIPKNTEKPLDGRKYKGKQAVQNARLLPPPIGISDFKKLVTNYYYVDKTLLIRDFLDAAPQVSLFTRPRRFGKTLTMDMLKTFFEISEENTADYFRSKKIWNCGEKYRRKQGIYPVISVTFKDIKFSTWTQTLEAAANVIAGEYRRHLYLLDSDRCNEYDQKYFRSIVDGTATMVGLSAAFRELSRMLHIHHGTPAVILVDEYDTPIQQGYSQSYYEQVIEFMRSLLSGAFKDNSSLAFGFLTGILRVAKESIFSGMNNLAIHSIFDEKYSGYFGFTREEITEMAEYYQMDGKIDEICDWYDGYRFGSSEIFNPWSVINYFYNDCQPKAYWLSTGDNSIIRQIVSEADEETTEGLRLLMQGKTVSTYVDTSIVYPEIRSDPTTVYSFLLAAGYLKPMINDHLYNENSICEVEIPNKEISYVYEKEILSALSAVIPPSAAVRIQQAILRQDIPLLEEQLQKFLISTISAFDYAHENFYHGLMLGICAVMNHLYLVDSNRESGTGRYDIQLKPLNHKMPGILIELKVIKNDVPEDRISEELDRSAAEALDQIDNKQYLFSMRQEGIKSFLKIGISFHKKQVRLESRTE